MDRHITHPWLDFILMTWHYGGWLVTALIPSYTWYLMHPQSWWGWLVTALKPSYTWYLMHPQSWWVWLVIVLLPSYSWYFMVSPLLVVRLTGNCSITFIAGISWWLSYYLHTAGNLWWLFYYLHTAGTWWWIHSWWWGHPNKCWHAQALSLSTDTTPCVNSSNTMVNRHKTLFQQFK